MNIKDIMIILGLMILFAAIVTYLAWTIDYLIKYYIDYGRGK